MPDTKASDFTEVTELQASHYVPIVRSGANERIRAVAGTDQPGMVRLASVVEAIEGTNDLTAVTPFGLSSALDALLAGDLITASEILTKLLTVDGTGSLLDADLLDGQEASAFAASGHNHDATYAALAHNHDATYAALAHNHDATYLSKAANGDSVTNLGAVEEAVNIIASATGTQNIDMATHGVYRVTMTGNCAFTFTNVGSSGRTRSVMIVLTGAFTPTFSQTITWLGQAFSYTNPMVINVFTLDGGTTFFGTAAGAA